MKTTVEIRLDQDEIVKALDYYVANFYNKKFTSPETCWRFNFNRFANADNAAFDISAYFRCDLDEYNDSTLTPEAK